MNETLVTRGDACAALEIGRGTLARRMTENRMSTVSVPPEFRGDDGVRVRESDVLGLGCQMYANFRRLGHRDIATTLGLYTRRPRSRRPPLRSSRR